MINIAIDGPAGAGKSSIAREIARRLGISYLDTGAMYRAIAWKAKQKHIQSDDQDAIVLLLLNSSIKICYDCDHNQRVYINDQDVTEFIRTQEIAEGASQFAVHLEIREAMISIQRKIAEQSDVVMDGRDIGTVVLPNATAKFFVTAKEKVRARRRFEQFKRKGTLKGRTFADVLQEVRMRDQHDMNREHGPLRKAEDAILIDTSYSTFQQSVEEVLAHLNQKILIENQTEE